MIASAFDIAPEAMFLQDNIRRWHIQTLSVIESHAGLFSKDLAHL